MQPGGIFEPAAVIRCEKHSTPSASWFSVLVVKKLDYIPSGVRTLGLFVGLQAAFLGAAGCSATNSEPSTTKTTSGTGSSTGSSSGSTTGGSTSTSGSGSSGATTGGTTSTGTTGAGGGSGATTGTGTTTTAGAGGGSGSTTTTTTGGGGSTGAGGSGTGGSGGSGGGTPGAGYWTSKDWHGCAWTGKGTAGVTTVAPQDFVTKPAADPYCISGTVGLDSKYESVALLGFNINEPTGANCTYVPVDTTKVGTPGVTPTAAGLAINFVKKGTDTSFTLRVQIQGPNGALAGTAGASDRWCATITEVQGKIFVPWSSFTPSCWATTAALKGTPYAMQPIDAVVFSVPGKLTDTPYNFCVNGVTYGATAADAPDGTAVAGDQVGTVGAADSVSPYAGDFARAKVNVGGKDYVIQNNNWGNPSGTDLILSYKNNSFKITTGRALAATHPRRSRRSTSATMATPPTASTAPRT